MLRLSSRFLLPKEPPDPKARAPDPEVFLCLGAVAACIVVFSFSIAAMVQEAGVYEQAQADPTP